ncbi:MAG: MoaD/ThiS family protein [Acidobacteriota bacterium]|nr:MoaD/ThiS family protein [Acidobacteriota bacterium]
MPLTFVLPGPLRELAVNRGEVRIDDTAHSVADALSLLWAQCPALRDRVVTERNELRPHINIFVDGESIRYSGGFDSPIRDGAEIFILPAVSGG